MLNALKDILLQIMLSGLFTFQIPLLFSKHLKPHGKDDRLQYRNLVVITCAISILFCFGLSATYKGMIPINLSILPLFVGILYGSRTAGLLLSLLNIGCHELIYGFSISGMVLHTGLPVYPLLFLFSSRFKRSNVMEKIGCLWTGLIPALIVIVASPVLEDGISNTSHNSETILMTLLYVLLSIFNGALLIYFIELMYNRLFINLPEEFDPLLQQIIDMVPLGVAVVDRKGNVAMLNEQLVISYKQTYPHANGDNIIGRAFYGMFEGTTQQDYLKRRIVQALQGFRSSEEIVRNGMNIYSIGVFPLFNEGTQQIEGAVAIIHDITELERLKSEFINIERLSLVGQMAASITHEIRNPMAVVRGFLQLMKEKSPDTLDHYYRIVMEELDRANGIISDFLSLAQNRIAEKEECHLHDIIHELSPLLWADANLRGQSIDLRLGSYIPSLHLNSKEMKQLILNLCRNGMEAMDDKGVLTIETHLVGETVEMRVKDTGPGIPKDKLDRLFEPFFTTKSKGTGLGLALCMSIVQRHHSTISVQSEEGVGTIFTVSFPIAETDKEPLLKP
ncbi:ATP-binding protein [Paenibacillus sp. N3/727]|uniref:two-component system sensor histidine kinase NtrB n=1 Tax=Paenibacillus sp. N3/727 TaxID=2925845 RepID=UPI001F53DC05|nr:ATP-binding protein [Paenibacillus sp. N3/727]UNK19221.1 ATP-binding protein [Paenibacillus sp. N3/727]